VGAAAAAALSRRRRGHATAPAPSESGGTAEPVPPSVTSGSARPSAVSGSVPPSAASASAAPIVTTEEGSGGRWGRTRAWASRGFTSTVGWLLVIGAAAGVYGWVYHPDTAVRRPPQSRVEVDFGPGRPARSPVTVGLRLIRDEATGNRHRSQVTLAIDLTGVDLASPYWTLTAIVPAGVRVNGALDDDPRTGQVLPYSGSHDEAMVSIAPGAVGRGVYTALLIWDDEGSSPLRVNGADLVASLPGVGVMNTTAQGAGSESSVPRPEVTVERQLSPSADYALLGGPPPDQQTEYGWSWKPQTGHANEGDVVFALQVEARSATLDERSRRDEFQSGIAFGVAAAALMAAVQESLTERRRNREIDPR
jgi:hypothetical protein